MSYCINPWCLSRQNADEEEYCQCCGSSLLINERYRIIKPLRELDKKHNTEIFEIDNLGHIKILKVLTSSRSKLIELFQQEVSLLSCLGHLGVPQMDTYFTFSLEDSSQQLYCLVMEKIPGQDLAKWLSENDFLSEELAIEWLLQLVKLLGKLHQEKILHRDIKPSNIILRPDKQLVLIDFGAARNQTDTYVGKLERGDVTRIYSPGYTALEQMKGEAIYQSDFFALGRTFVHLLTGIHPNELPIDYQNQHLLWREKAPNISDNLFYIIERMIAPLPQKRLQHDSIILELEKLREKQKYQLDFSQISGGHTKQIFVKAKNIIIRKQWQGRSNLYKLFIVSLAVAIFIICVRDMGILQPFELQAFDHLMTMRPIEQEDTRLLIITIDEADIKYQNQKQMSMQWSLSDQALTQLLKKLERYKPKTIGIDIYRDFPVNPDYPDLETKLRSDNRFFVPCKVSTSEKRPSDGISPPPEIPESRLSFSDFVADDNEFMRRHLLHLTPPRTSLCTAQYALSLQMALHYLDTKGINAKILSNGQLQIGKVNFRQLTSHTSGYQNIDASGYQIILNYRSLQSPLDIAQQISLRDILEDQIAPELIESLKNRIVIIGVTASSAVDYWKTPHSSAANANQKQIPGIFVQAHAIAHILSAVLDRRPIIWWWDIWLESLWILGWSFLAGIVASYIHRPWYYTVAVAIKLLILFSICYFTISFMGGWIPLVPSALAIITIYIINGCINAR